MLELKEKILSDGEIIEPDILKVDSFINHQIDPKTYRSIAKEIKRRFAGEKIDKILTIEASGIALGLSLIHIFLIRYRLYKLAMKLKFNLFRMNIKVWLLVNLKLNNLK